MPSGAKSAIAEQVSQVVQDSLSLTGDGSEQAAASQASGEAQLPEYMKGIIKDDEWKAMTPENRQKLGEYGKSLYGDYQRKTEQVAREREQLEDLKGRMEETLREAVNKTTVSQARQETRDFFDDLVGQTTDPTVREQLGKLKTGILQLTKAEEIGKRLEQIEQTLQRIAQTNQVSRTEQLRSAYQAFSDPFRPLLQKYEKAAMELGVQYPNLSPKKLLQLVATEEEYDTAVQAEAAKQVKKEVQRTKETVTLKPTGATGTVTATEQDKMPSKTPKLFGSRWNTKALIERAFPDVKAGQPT